MAEEGIRPQGANPLEKDITIKDMEAGTSSSALDEIINSYDVVMFSKSTCPFCFELKRTLVEYGISYAVFEADLTGDIVNIKAHLNEKSGMSTFPNLFIKGESVGGCMDIKKKEHSGEFQKIIAPFVGKPGPTGINGKVTSLGLFWFPETVDNNIVRWTGGLSAIYCIFCMAFFDRLATKWAVLALALDYLLRFVYSGNWSVAGSISAFILSRTEPKWSCGAPKQFANFCGLFMSTFAAALYVSGEPIGGAVVLGGLAVAAGLSFFDFCFGCIIFGFMVKFGILSPLVYAPYLNLLASKKWMHEFTNDKETSFPVAENERLLMPWQTAPTDADLVRKVRPETEYKNQDFDLIRHARVELFAVPMTAAAIAFMFKAADLAGDGGNRYRTETAYETIGIISSVLFVGVLVLYLLRLVFYPTKVLKEWAHPVMGNYFSAISICFTIYGILLNKDNDSGAMTLIFIGATLQMIITILRVSDLIYSYIGEDMLNPSLMMAPVGNFICAVGFAQYQNIYQGSDRNGEMGYLFVSRLWFGVAALFAIVLFTITFKKALHDHHSDNRLRATLWIWLATASIAGPAFLSVAGGTEEVGRGVLFQSLWCIALLFFVVNAVGLIKTFYSYPKDMSIWLMPFSLAAFGAATVTYDSITQDAMFFVLGCISMTIACVSAAVCTMLTFTWASDLSLFKPRPKWGPISFMKLTHEVFRFAIPKYVSLVESVQEGDVGAVERLAKQMDGLVATFDEHSRHEDLVLFPRIRRYFPQLNETADAQHASLHADMDAMTAALREYNSSEDKGSAAVAGAFLAVLKEKMPGWALAVMPHLRDEESTFTTVARKYMPLEEQIKTAEQVFDTTGSSEWRKVFAFMLANLPSVEWKVRYVKTFLWANPARAQEIGLIIYHSVDEINWLVLTRELPQIVPRGVAGHKRIY